MASTERAKPPGGRGQTTIEFARLLAAEIGGLRAAAGKYLA
jgi:hypothetical protein